MKADKKKIISIITVVTAVILFAVWAFLATIYLCGVKDAGGYNERVGTRFIAHRGYSGKYFQNTVQAFKAAGQSGFFQGIETDVWSTADGVYVCCHDETPFCDKSVKVTESLYDDIKDMPLDLSSAGADVDLSLDYRICTLSEYLNICYGYRKLAVIEIKQKFNREEAEALATFARGFVSWRNLIFCSFNKNVVDYVYDANPYVGIMLFTSDKTKATLYSAMGYNVGVAKGVPTKKFVDGRHKKGEFVNAYTVNDSEEARALIGMGVDFITTDVVLSV
ncbi:MAG: glycerophosphodiester phosphodiesterase [Christensenellales bacterium]